VIDREADQPATRGPRPSGGGIRALPASRIFCLARDSAGPIDPKGKPVKRLISP
jgi:hypothetical protein